MIIRDDLKEHQLIVGCVRDSQIHVEASAFNLMAGGLYDKLISMAEAKFMAACVDTDGWKMLAMRQPIFGLDENGVPCFVKDGFIKPRPVEEPAPLAAVEGEVIQAEVTIQ